MGKGDTAGKLWLSDKERFADLFNGTVFQGKQVIKAEELEMVRGESDIILTDKNNQPRKLQRYRDIVMKWKNGTRFVLLACENQERIHYAMPVRTMLYDGLSYIDQMREIWKEQDKKGISQEEFLSRFRKEDTLYPIITIVFYYGEKEWDASKDLHSMIDKNLPTELWEMIKAYIPNYHINIIDPNNIRDFERFQTDLQVVLGMLQYRNDKSELLKYVMQHKEYFECVDQDTYNAIREFMNSEKVLKTIIGEKEEVTVDMCKALQDLFDEGIEQGIEKGIEKGMEQGVRAMIDTCKEFECSRDTTLQKLVEKIPLSEERASEYMEKYWDK